MKLLLDENLPRKLKQDFHDYEIFTVREQGWNGRTNGELLKLMVADKFEVLITFEKNLEHQQNFEKYPLSVIVLTAVSNQYIHLHSLVDHIKQTLRHPAIGITIIGK